MFQIREVTKEDFDAFQKLQNLIHSYHQNERPDIYIEHHIEQSRYDSLLEENNRKVFFVENGIGESIAYAMIKVTEDPEAAKKNMVQRKVVTISEIYVLDAYRGRGIGKMLFNKACSYGKAQGAISLELGVWEFNQSAIKFYEMMGMTIQTRRMEIKL